MEKLIGPVYIPSIEGSDIYNHTFRDRELDINYVGMIPSSLELNKLISVGLRTTKKKTNDKLLSTDIINVKFKQKVKSGTEIIKSLNLKIDDLDDDKESYRNKLNEYIHTIESDLSTAKWSEVSNEDLRTKLYTEGFVYNTVKYVVYKRSSAKSRIGQCLFIKEKLYDPMINWSRMNLNFANHSISVDYPSLLAYESLVGSSLENVITINPKNILIITDVESKCIKTCNIVRTGVNGYLNSFTDKTEIKNSLFDGESLLDSRYFTDNKGMMLLRNHMFKSAAFNCNIQEYLKSQCPDNIDYNDWSLTNMFGMDILASDVHLIITPTSLKALKFSHLLGLEADMWEHWKQIVIDDDCAFGVCKHEKKSKRGLDENGNVLQQTSYQMLNSLPLTRDDIKNFSDFDKYIIEKLKNNDDYFIKFIKESANDINSNNMFVDLYYQNRDIVGTKIFRKFRTEAINAHVNHIKRGKIRMHGDYLVMLGNPMEFLSHAVGKLDLNNPSLKENEIHTTMFELKEVTGFRNPHTSPSNVLVAKNIFVKDIGKYFNLTDNIVCVNAIGFPLQDILSGCDYDSDTVLMIDNDDLLKISKKLFGKYRVCINKVESSKKEYRVCSYDMSLIDKELSKSQKYIGRTVNVGQLCMSTYWDRLNKGCSESELSELMQKIDVVTVLSGICIDLAKKMFEIDIKKEIDFVAKTKELKKEKPLFWKYVSQNKTVRTTQYECPMDFLFNEMDEVDKASHRKNIDFKDMLIKHNLKTGDRKQQTKIIDYIDDMCMKINGVYNNPMSDEERDENVDEILKYYKFYIDKLKVSQDTMYSLLLKISKHKKDKISSRMLNIIYKAQKDKFLMAFKKTPHF
ncbi:hypothetical protein ABHN03_16680 [Paenibacillus sp. NRS-1775]|uniref:hypothetical protein n=1 Tax=unclassified Paenibacillus TaxID=185978 RepID=UPI003D28F115